MNAAADPLAAPERGIRWARRWGWCVIALAVLLTYWPLSTFQYTLTHGDTLNCWLPWRWMIASCLHDGHFPLWDPYQQFGYPLYADLQGPAWYVEALALGGTIGQGIHVLQGLFLLYVILGGVGSMRLVRTLQGDDRVALVIGTAYALGGFFTGHQMHFYAVISACWSPWLLDAFIRLLRAPCPRVAVEAAVCQYLLLTGGNHTFTIIGAYVMAGLFIAHAWPGVRKSGWIALRPLAGYGLLFVVLAAVLACGTLYAWWEVSPHLARADGLAYEHAAQRPFTWKALGSFFFPYAMGTDQAWLGTDPTMANGYMGILMLVFALPALWRKRNRVENVLLIAGAVCALAAFGSALPVHHWLWAYVPGMDLFRFPSYFLWFTWVAVLVLAAGTLRRAWEPGAASVVPRVLLGTAVMAVLIAVCMAFARETPATEAFHGLFARMNTAGRPQRVLLAALIVLPVVTIALVLAWRKRLGFPALLALVVLEMGWNTSLAQWNTAVADLRPQVLAERLAACTPGPVRPVLRPMGEAPDDGRWLHYLMHNVQDFVGRPTHGGFNSFWLKNAMELEMKHAPLWQAMDRRPLAYFADRVVPEEAYDPTQVDPAHDSSLAVWPTGSPLPAGITHRSTDRVELQAFRHDEVALTTHTDGPALVVLQQSSYPGWEASIDGAWSPVSPVNIAAMGVVIPAGTHSVVFRFSKPVVPVLLGISLVALFIALGFLAWGAQHGPWARIGVVVLAGMIAWSLFGHRPRAERLPAAMAERIAELPIGTAVVLNTDLAGGDIPREHRTLRADGPEGLVQAWSTLRRDTAELWWVDGGLRPDAGVRAWVKDRYDVLERRGGEVEAVRLRRADQEKGEALYRALTPDGKWLCEADLYTPAFRIGVDTLRRTGGACFVVDLRCRSPRGAQAFIIIERQRDGRVLEQFPFPITAPPAGADTAWTPAYAVWSATEWPDPEERIATYAWNPGTDSIAVRDLRVRVMPERYDRW